jgi:hypothetical protein
MLHVVARSSDVMVEWSRRHPAVAALVHSHVGQRSYFDVLNNVIWAGSQDYALVVHDDVFLSELIVDDVAQLVATLNTEWPAWGVCGNAGVLSFEVGFQPTSVVRFLYDPHGGPNFQGAILPAESVDGNVLLLNTRALRSRDVRLPAFDGFQLYDLVLCIESLCHGLAVLVAPQLACLHLSRGSQQKFGLAAKSEGFHRYISQRLANRSIQTLNGILEFPLETVQKPSDLVDLKLQSLRVAARGRPQKHVAVVVRTQFRDPRLLRRTLETVRSFAIAAGEATKFVPTVITDCPERRPDFVDNYAEVQTVATPDGDSRHWLLKLAGVTEAEYIWFVDDDDWLFPNAAEWLGLIVNIAQSGTTFFGDVQWFHESIDSELGGIGGNYSAEEGRYYQSKKWMHSLSGENHIPFCGMIVPTEVVRALNPRLVEHVVYFEDLALQLHALMHPSAIQIVVGRLLAGISVRGKGNSITAMDRTVWNKSYAEMVACICRDSRWPNLFSLWPPPSMIDTGALAGMSRPERSLVLAYRLVRGILIVVSSPRHWASRTRTALRMLRRDGLMAAVRFTTTLR